MNNSICFINLSRYLSQFLILSFISPDLFLILHDDARNSKMLFIPRACNDR